VFLLAFGFVITSATTSSLPELIIEGPVSAGSSSARLTLRAEPGDYWIQTSTTCRGVWQNEIKVTIISANSVDFELTLNGRDALFVRAAKDEPTNGGVWDEVLFQTQGATFEPELRCLDEDLPSILWTWSDGTTSGDYPIAFKDFGSPGTRVQHLSVDQANPLTVINIGFDGSLGGETLPLNVRPPQGVSAVAFAQPLTQLEYWASAFNPITNTLDFSGFVSLKSIDCYQCTELQGVVVSNLPSLERLVVEACVLRQLDLSGLPNLGEVRGARNAFTNIVLGGGTGPNIWHWSTWDNPQLTQSLREVMTNFYSLQTFWSRNSNQKGPLSFVSTNLISVRGYRNQYTELDLTGHSNLEQVRLYENRLTNIALGGNVALRELNVRDNRLTTGVLDEVLHVLDVAAPSIDHIDLTQNSERPSPAGYNHYWNLVGRGVAVFVDWPEENDGRLNEPGGSQAITFVTTSRNPQLEIRTNSATPVNVTWHWGDGTVTQGPTVVSHYFATAGVYTNYVEVDPPEAVTYFGAPRRLSGQGISAVTGLANFPNLNFLYLFREEISDLSLAGCANLRQLHLARNPVSSSVVDQWFIDLDAAVSGPVTNADFWYPPDLRTSASDAAWNSLIQKGYVMRPFPEETSDPDIEP
jgi:Leucine-rich repeat (LRR) protein